MKKQVLLFFILFSTVNIGFSAVFFTPQERAYLFHVVKKNQVLERTIGEYFNYTGEWVKLYPSEVLDYDSLEQIVILEPGLLTIDFEGIKSAPQSILVEASAKLALWKLMQFLAEPNSDANKGDYKHFVSQLNKRLPDQAFKDKNRKYRHKEVNKLLNPNLSLLDKRDIVHEIEDLTLKEKRDILTALDSTYKQYTFVLTSRYYDMLGGSISSFNNILLAAGEGSKTNGMMEEFDKKENGKLDKSQPKGIGLFTYQYEIKKNNAGIPDIFVKTDPVVEYIGYPDPKNTQVHLSLWGFNAFFQTTVVLKAGGNSYLLFANRDSKELSPDSTYAYGKTYQDHINDLEKKTIPELEEELYGKSGHWANHNNWKERKDVYYDEIRKSEVAMRTYELEKNKKKLKRARERYLDYNNRYNTARSRIKKIYRNIFKKEQRLDLLKDQLFYMKSNLGFSPQAYRLVDSVYIFEDGSSFNPFTQDFKFANIMDGIFTVRLISIGSKPMSQIVDEVQLMVNVLSTPPGRQVKIDLNLNDGFKSNSFAIDQLPESFITHPGIDTLINYLVDEKKTPITYLFGAGVGKKTEQNDLISDPEQIEIEQYPGLTKKDKEKRKNEPEFKSLRKTKVAIGLDESIIFTISSYTDPVISTIGSLANNDSLYKELMKPLEGISDNQLLSCLRTMATLEAVINTIQNRLSKRSDIEISDLSKVSEILSKTKARGFVEYDTFKINWQTYQQFKSLFQ